MQTHPGPGPRGHIIPPAAPRGKAVTSSRARSETAPCGSGAPGKSGRTEAEHGRRGAGRGTAAGMHSGLRSRRAIADCEFATSRGTRGGAYGERRDRPGTRKRNRTGPGAPRFKRKRFQTHVLTCAVKTICHGVCKFRVQPQDRRWSCTSMSGCPPAHPPAAKTTRRICAITLLSLALVTTRRLSGLATSAGHTTRRGRAALHSRGVGARVPTPHRRRPCRPHRRRPCRPWLVAPSP